jgi:hypothetical protein
LGYPEYVAPQASGAGTASFIIALIAGLGLLVTIAILGVMAIHAPNQQLDEKAPEVIALGSFILIGMGAALVGVILGFVNISQANRKKTFGIIGLIINGCILLGTLGLMVTAK